MIEEAQAKDFDVVAAIYREQHPQDAGKLSAAVEFSSRTFIASDDDGRMLGFAMVIALNCGVTPYGVIHQLETSPTCPGLTRQQIRDGLVEACVSWLAEHGITLVYARTVDKGTHIEAMLRYGRSRRWVLDPSTGEVIDAGPARDSTRDPSLLPQSVQAARYTSA